jgi:hypothetical protein
MANRTKIILSAVAIFCSVAAILGFLYELPPRLNASLHREIGAAMAKATLDLCKPGGKVVVIKRDTAEFPQPASDAQFTAFEKELRRAKVPIESIHLLQLDPLRPTMVPPGDFFEMIRKAAAGTVIVSFMGPPLLSDEQRAALREIRPKIVAFCAGMIPSEVNVAMLFKQNLLHAAILAKHPIHAGAKQSTFPQLYEVLRCPPAI